MGGGGLAAGIIGVFAGGGLAAAVLYGLADVSESTAEWGTATGMALGLVLGTALAGRRGR